VVKSSISLFRRKPAPVTVTALPNPDAVAGGVGVARSGRIWARSSAAYDFDSSRSIGMSTKSGSPSQRLRSMNARRIASAARCTYRALPNGGKVS
jgi:hypothetical protein